MSEQGRDLHAGLGRELARRLEERDECSRRAHAVAAEAIGLPAGERPAFVAAHPDCLTAEFIELMIAIARERRGPAPEESVAYAHLAATAAEAATATGVEVDEARALAFAELGNAHRICGDLRRAGIAFGLARERVRYAADPLVRAEVDSLEASYRLYRCEFARADRLLRRAEAIQRRYGCPNALGKIQIQRGNVAQLAGDPERAIEFLRAGTALVDPEEEPRLVLAGIHNLAFCLIDLGNPDEALTLLRRHRPDYEHAGSDADRARLSWLEGKAARRAGLLGLAAANLEEVSGRFTELGMPYETASVLLDLAEVYAEQDRWADVEEVAAATLALCRGCGVGAEGVAAASLLQQAVENRQQSRERLAALAAEVRSHLNRQPR